MRSGASWKVMAAGLISRALKLERKSPVVVS